MVRGAFCVSGLAFEWITLCARILFQSCGARSKNESEGSRCAPKAKLAIGVTRGGQELFQEKPCEARRIMTNDAVFFQEIVENDAVA